MAGESRDPARRLIRNIGALPRVQRTVTISTQKTLHSTHVIVVEDAPHVHKALLDGCGVRMYRVAGADDEATLLHPGVVAFDLELPWTDLRSLTDRLRDLLRLEPDAILTARPAQLIERCAARGVPVHTVPTSGSKDARTVRVVILDAAAAEQHPSRALRAPHSGIHERVQPPSDPAPLRKLG